MISVSHRDSMRFSSDSPKGNVRGSRTKRLYHAWKKVSRKVGPPFGFFSFLPRKSGNWRRFLYKFTWDIRKKTSVENPRLLCLFYTAAIAAGAISAASTAATASAFLAGFEHGAYCQQHDCAQNAQHDYIAHNSYLL